MIGCTQSPVFPYDRQGRVLSNTRSHLGFLCTEWADTWIYSGGERGVSSQTVPRPLSRFKTHSQARLGTSETKMAALNAKCSISTMSGKNRGR